MNKSKAAITLITASVLALTSPVLAQPLVGNLGNPLSVQLQSSDLLQLHAHQAGFRSRGFHRGFRGHKFHKGFKRGYGKYHGSRHRFSGHRFRGHRGFSRSHRFGSHPGR